MSGIWREFKSQVYHHKTNTTENTTRSANQNYFLQLTKDETFTDKLFYLEDNLFVPDEHFNKIQGLEEFFNDIIINSISRPNSEVRVVFVILNQKIWCLLRFMVQVGHYYDKLSY